MNKLMSNEQVNFETWNYEQVNEQWTSKLQNMKLWTS